MLQAVRASCPGTPISLSTSADVEPDPESRFRAVASWTELPDLVTANQGEVGIVELCAARALLATRGIGIEAGLLSLDDAQTFVAAGVAYHCVRVMVEPLDADPDAAIAHAAAMERLEGRDLLCSLPSGQGADDRRLAVPAHGEPYQEVADRVEHLVG